jgi:hypothetical protein
VEPRDREEPAGLVGRVIGRLLNRGNRSVILAAVNAAEASNGGTVAEIGFGGGAGLALLLEQVGPTGVVHGIEISQTILAGARRRFAKQVKKKQLQLHHATMQLLPFTDGSVDAVVSTNTIYFVDSHGPNAIHQTRVRTSADGRGLESLRLAGLTLIEDRRVGDGAEAFHVLACERRIA